VLLLSLDKAFAFHSVQVPKHAALVWRGDCPFTTKARIAQAAGAVSLIIVNDKEELYKMVCSKNETYTDIRIPSVMVPKSAGESLEKAMHRGEGRSRMLALV
jgi:signal peptide peptidase-like protein 2B